MPTDACPDLEDPWYSSDLKKHDLAVKHGAKAVIYCDEDDEDNQRSVWGNSDHVNSNDNMNTLGNRTWLRVPTIDLRPASVQELFKLLKEAGQKGQPITAKLTHGMKNVTTHNIHATTRIGNASSILHLGAHSDSVPPGPGLNDNASGSIALLEIATALTNFTTCNTVRFSWWTAEEVNLGGSEYYVKTLPAEDKAKTKLYLNFDMIASPNFAVQLDGPLSAGWNHSSGMPQLAHKVFAHYFKDIAGGNYTDVPRVGEERVQVGRSDHDPFIAAGMAAMSVQTGAGSNKTVEEVELFGGRADAPYDPNYHQKGDTVQNMNMGIWEIMARGAAHVVAVFGRSFEDPDAKHSDMGV